MAAQKGRSFLVQTGSPLASIMSTRSVSMSINNETVDVTTAGSAGFTKLLADAGNTTVTIDFDGVYEADAAHEVMYTRSLARTVDAYSLINEEGDAVAGDFQITGFTKSGTYNGEEAYSVSLQSSGVVTFTAGA